MPGAPVEALRPVPLFADLNRREMAKIARLFKERRFAVGETVVKEGSGAAAFFLIEGDDHDRFEVLAEPDAAQVGERVYVEATRVITL